MASLQKRIRAGRKDLDYVAKDLRKILELGERTQNVDSDSLLDDTNKFRASVGTTAILQQEYLNTFKEISHLAASEDDSEVDLFPTDADLSNRKEFNDMYLTIVQYQQQLSKVDKVVEHNDNNNWGNSSFLNNSLARTRLPKISLPHFNGNIETWPKFKLLFESMVHSNPEIPLIEKFHYLHTSLSGESFSLIASLTLNEENYDEAWNAICRRYDNKRLLANTYIDKFLDFAPLKGNQNLPALQSFVSNVGETVAGFKSIGIDDESDFIWLSLALRKLDATTREQFEAHSIGTKQQPTFGRLIEFVQERCQVLQFSCSSPSSSLSSSKVTKPTNHSKVFTTMTSPSKQSASLKPNICNCKPSHPLFLCPTFKAKTPSERRDFARRKSLCFNCLTSGHMVNECNSRFSCKHCQGKHNTLLHDKEVRNHNRARSWSPPKNQVRPKQSSSRPPTPTIIASVTGSNAVILGTAKALVRDCQGKLQPVRLLLDCGSQCSLITTKCIKRLGLSWIPSNIRPIGAGEILLPKIKGKSQCQLFSSQDPKRLYELSPLVVNNITGMLPSSPLPCPNFKNYGTLADPDFNKPAKIDILIGGDLFMKVITGAPRSIDQNYDALPTVFGLVIMGVLNHPNMSEDTPHCHLITKPNSTDQLLARFWETEEVAPPSVSYENDPCEQHFKATHARDSSGRYVLALPFKDLPLGLEGSKNRALVQYKSLERKMGQNLDLGSRGCFPPQIVSNALWWAGPDFLYDKNWVPPKPPVFSGEVPELRAKHVLLLESQESHLYDWIGTMSRYLTVLRTHGYVLRALKNFRYPRNRVTGELTNEEMQSSLHSLIKIVQRHTFASDYSWTDERPLTTKLKTLAVYLDSEGILRVGGRLHHSDLPVETQSPILLPGNCHFTRLLIRHQHVSHLHLGYQGLHALLNRTFWIFGLRQAIKSQLHRCLPCLKLRARPQNPLMGDLPASRVRPSRPFSHCGIDYAGPFTIKHSAKRNSAKSKAYLCLFICMATRAVHLEVVSALSTEAFLATFDRFIARRGCPSNVISDNGTNFVGAYNQLKELFVLVNSQPHQDRLTKYSTIKGFSWHFNPPHSPHFGGLWEAAVKSAKHHLYKVTNCQAFYFEELTTLFARIEAVMNSRPLCTSSNDASSDNVLTPGHFLIGAPLISAPEKNITDLKVNYLSRWQLINQCVQHFWNRWQVEYLQSLQRRIKWFNPANKPIKPDDLVLVPDSSSLPLQWRVGRVTECFPGKDGIVRVISVKDHRGVFKHPIHKIVNISQVNDSQDI